MSQSGFTFTNDIWLIILVLIFAISYGSYEFKKRRRARKSIPREKFTWKDLVKLILIILIASAVLVSIRLLLNLWF